MTDLTADNPGIVVEGNPQTEPSTLDNGISNQNGEATQSATVQDTFIPVGLDVNTLPPNVRSIVDKINKDMVRGFTEKTSKISETIKSEIAKATEPLKSKSDLYDQIATQEEFVKQWNDYVQKTTQQSGAPAQGDKVLTEMKQQLQEMNQKIQLSEMSQITEAFAEALDEKGTKLHPEFDALNELTIGQLNSGASQPEEFSLLRASIELAQGNTPQERLANGYKSAKATYDRIFELGKKAGMGRIQTKVLNGSQPASNSMSDTQAVTEKRPKNAHEALEMARKGIRVSN